MPNWCSNHAVISHKDKNMIDKFIEAYNQDKTCSIFLPEPSTTDHKEYDWYNWRISNWGTKWDIGKGEYGEEANRIDDNTVEVRFLSAWSPPNGLYEHLIYLDYDVDAKYFEPGMMFCGYHTNNGESSMRFAEFALIPRDICEQFNINPEEYDEDDDWVEDEQ